MTNAQQGWFPDPTTAGQLRWWDGSAWTEHVSREGATPEPVTKATPVVATTGAGLRKIPVWGWIAIGAVGIVALVVLAPLMALLAIVVLVTAIVGLTRGTPTFLRLKSRNIAIGAIAASAAVLIVSGSVSAAVQPRVDTELAPPVASASATPTPTRTATPTPTPVVRTKDEVVVEAIPFERANADDPNRPRGENVVSTPGANGERTITYTVTLTDGVETARVVASDVVSLAPVTEITSVGVYDPPAPVAPAPVAPAPVAQGGCHPSYEGACVPMGVSDVDCAGGKGDGPEYVRGPLRVVGADVYDLDGNGDGVACQS